MEQHRWLFNFIAGVVVAGVWIPLAYGLGKLAAYKETRAALDATTHNLKVASSVLNGVEKQLSNQIERSITEAEKAKLTAGRWN